MCRVTDAKDGNLVFRKTGSFLLCERRDNVFIGYSMIDAYVFTYELANTAEVDRLYSVLRNQLSFIANNTEPRKSGWGRIGNCDGWLLYSRTIQTNSQVLQMLRE